MRILPKDHVINAAPKQRKKRSKRGKYVYNQITSVGMDMYVSEAYAPTMKLSKSHMWCIVHNIWWMMADQMTAIDLAAKKLAWKTVK